MKQGKYQNICTDIIFKRQKIKDKEKILKEVRGRNRKGKPYLWRNKDKNYLRHFFKDHARKKRVE